MLGRDLSSNTIRITNYCHRLSPINVRVVAVGSARGGLRSADPAGHQALGVGRGSSQVPPGRVMMETLL